jgi:hypothetical protein
LAFSVGLNIVGKEILLWDGSIMKAFYRTCFMGLTVAVLVLSGICCSKDDNGMSAESITKILTKNGYLLLSKDTISTDAYNKGHILKSIDLLKLTKNNRPVSIYVIEFLNLEAEGSKEALNVELELTKNAEYCVAGGGGNRHTRLFNWRIFSARKDSSLADETFDLIRGNKE